MVEMLVVVAALAVLASMLGASMGRAREQARRSSCGGNCGNVIKCCHLYSDAPPNLGRFPVYVAAADHKSESGDGHTTNGHLALAQLYGAYVKDHRVYSCPSNSTNTAGLPMYVPPTPPAPPAAVGYTNYGYDPGHTPVHATAGVFGDLGVTHSTNHENSTNHGFDGPGQNIAIGAGSVEWWDAADARATKDADGSATADQIYADDWDKDAFPEELETWIME
jgi:hypothetical protein